MPGINPHRFRRFRQHRHSHSLAYLFADCCTAAYTVLQLCRPAVV